MLHRSAQAFCKTTSHCFFNFPHASMHARLLIHVWLSVTPWSVAHQAPLSMEFSRREYWSGLPFHTPGDLPDPGIESKSLASPALAGRFFTTAPPGKPLRSPQAQLNFISWSTPLGVNKNHTQIPLCSFTLREEMLPISGLGDKGSLGLYPRPSPVSVSRPLWCLAWPEGAAKPPVATPSESQCQLSEAGPSKPQMSLYSQDQRDLGSQNT